MTTSEAPLDREPLCDEAEFAAGLEGLVAAFAPRLFALVEEAGERVDGRIVAWGMAFDDHAEVVGANRAFRGTFRSADSARELFSYRGKMRLVWHNPQATTRPSSGTTHASSGQPASASPRALWWSTVIRGAR